MRTNDITLAAFPKSGITYLSFLLASARCLINKTTIQPTWYNIDWLVIDTHKMGNRPRGRVWEDGVGDFLKTHAAAPVNAPNVIYLLRNPFDTLKSYYHFTCASDKDPNAVRSPELFARMGVIEWNNHVASWLLDPSPARASQSLHLVTYEELLADSGAVLMRLLYALGFQGMDSKIGVDLAARAARYSAIDSMRGYEQAFANYNPLYRRFNLEFVRTGGAREVPEFDSQKDYILEHCGPIYAKTRG
jgi:hypothetical protein